MFQRLWSYRVTDDEVDMSWSPRWSPLRVLIFILLEYGELNYYLSNLIDFFMFFHFKLKINNSVKEHSSSNGLMNVK